MKPILIAPLLAGLVVVSGCYVTAEPAAAVGVTYTPMRYDGYVVYYDAGEPFYVVRGRRHYIPRGNPRYQRYIRHYQTYRDHDAYHQWQRDHRPRPDYDARGPRVRDTRRRHAPR